MKISLFLVSLILAASAGFAAGPSEGGGGFAFKNSIQLLKFSSDELLENLEVYDQKCFSKILQAKSLRHDVNIESLRTLVKNVRSGYFKNLRRRTSAGELQPLNFNYGKDRNGPYIEALNLFFVSFMTVLPEEASMHSSQVSRLLLHEAAHLFGYSEIEAEQFAVALQEISVFKTSDEMKMAIFNDPRRMTSQEAEMSLQYFSCEE